MNKHEERLQFYEITGTWLSAVIMVIGGVFGIFQYLEHKRDVRIERSMNFVERFQDNTVTLEARKNLSRSIDGQIDELNALLSNKVLKAKELSALYDAEIVKLVKQDTLTEHLKHIFTFYEQLVYCVEMELCDREVADMFFETEAKSLIRTFYPYICHIRKEWYDTEVYATIVRFYIGEKAEICKE